MSNSLIPKRDLKHIEGGMYNMVKDKYRQDFN